MKSRIVDTNFKDWLDGCKYLIRLARQPFPQDKPWRKWYDANLSVGAAVTKAFGKSWSKL